MIIKVSNNFTKEGSYDHFTSVRVEKLQLSFECCSLWRASYFNKEWSSTVRCRGHRGVAKTTGKIAFT